MANKAPKKKESKEQISQSREANISASQILHDSATKRKPPIPIWVEWSDQDIANEKWDTGKVARDRGRSPTATNSCYEDSEGKIDLPATIRSKVHSWKRPFEIFNDRVPTVVSADHLNESHIDLLSPNEHITDSELIRHILSTFSSLYGIFASTPTEPENVSSIIKMKASISKDAKDSKVEKGKKDEYVEEMGWRPWHQIWPKEGTKGNNMPAYNPQGKYAVKMYWMGCYRKIIVDDTIPCDENLKPLLPVTCRGNEIWPVILTKALIKVASLDYYGGLSSSEFGDSNVIHCLTGWLPESIPIEPQNSGKIWDLLLQLLPHWTLPSPRAPKCEENCPIETKKAESIESDTPSKQELLPRESKAKKDEKGGKDDKKIKANEKTDKNKGSNDKPVTPAVTHNCKKSEQPTPDYILYATFLNPPSSNPPCKFSEYKQMANISEKLRQFGLCQNISHPVYLNTVRRCPLLPPPEPLKIPRWKLIRQKKNREIVEPKLNAEDAKEKDPKALQLKSMFFNFNLNHADMTSSLSKNDSIARIPSICEEGQDDPDPANPVKPPDVPEVPTPEISIPDMREMAITTPDIENAKKLTRSPSVASSQSSQTKKSGKSKERKSAQRERKESSRHSIDIPPPVSIDEPPPETSDLLSEVAAVAADMPDIPELDIEKDKDDEGKETDIWMDFEDFLQCFSTLWVYHKPKKYLKNIADIKSFDQKSDKPRKSAGTNQNDVKNVPAPPSFLGGLATDSMPPFLLFDCVEQAEVVIHFSSMSRWFDPNLDISIRNQGKEQDALIKQVLTPTPGTLMVEPYFWKQIVTPSPLIRLSTTGVRCVVLTLPPGRHVLRFMINTPLGYHISVSSPQSFIFDDEHVIIQHLTKVSERYISHAVDTLKQLKTISQGFYDKCITRSVPFALGTEDQSESVRKEHYETFFSSLVSILKTEMGENFTGKTQFAINALKFEAYFHMAKPKNTHVNIIPSPSPIEDLGGIDDVPIEEDDTAETDMAAVKVQSTFKGFYTRLLMRAYNYPDSKENKLTVEMLEKIWTCIDANIETIASNVYMKLFEERPGLYPLFPFYQDQSNKVTFNDYNGSYSEPTVTSWFLIFRELFYVLEPNLILPKLYTNLQNYQLKVIDNDTKEELKSLFSKVVPQTLTKNKSGYTFVATASHHSSVPSGKFRLRIIGANDNLPICAKDGFVSTQFVTKEIRDHYIPNRYNRILRHTVKVTDDVLTSIQFLTSKDDVMVKLQVLDDNEVIYSCEGKKTVTVPALIFKKDRSPPSEKNSRASSQTGSIISVAKSANPKQASRRNSSPEKMKRNLFKMAELKSEDEITEEEVHKYIVECFVLRDSWPLTRKEWIFVENQKNTDTIEKEMSSDSITKADPTNRGSAGKNRKNTRQESRAKKERPPSQNQNLFDTSKAHWTLRFIVDAHLDASIEIKRDVQREEEIKAIKAAWETVEPGRAARAIASRQKYLESHTVREPIDEEKNENVDEEQGEKMEDDVPPPVEPLPTESPVPSEPDTGELFSEPPMKENLPRMQPFDVTPYIRSSGQKTILDEIEEERRQTILQNKFANFHEQRERVLQMRENCRISRNLEKEKQILEYEKMQINLDEARAELYRARETYRNKFIPQSLTDAEADADKKKNKSPSPKAKASKSRGKKK